MFINRHGKSRNLDAKKVLELERIVAETDSAKSWQPLEEVFNHDI